MKMKPVSQAWLQPQVRMALRDASHAVLNRALFPAPMSWNDGALYVQFASRYASLCALPRRSRRALERSWKKPLAVIALLLTLGQSPAWAATIYVDTNTPPELNADGRCSLVEAVINANDDAALHRDCIAGSGSDTIVLPEKSQQRIKVPVGYDGVPPITSRIVIEGRNSTISCGRDTTSLDNFFSITSSGDLTLNDTRVSGIYITYGTCAGGITNAGVLTLNGATIEGASSYNPGVRNSGTAFINNSLITNNHYGGIYNAGGTVILLNSTVSKNGDPYRGGGIHNDQNGTVTLIDSLVTENEVGEGYGGGISNAGILTLVGTRILNNDAYGGGGGISNGGTASLTGSTVAGNRSELFYTGGGGILSGGTLTLTNSTVSNNTAASGGGIYAGGTVTLRNTTVTANKAVLYRGGGLLLSGGDVTLTRSLITGNSANEGPEVSVGRDNPATFVAGNYNIFGHDGDAGMLGVAPGATDIVPTVPVAHILLPLADNGGKSRTQTHALALNSPALDASPAGEGCPAKDQRGVTRPRGAGCDIGAFEGSAVLCNGVVTTHVGTPNNDVIYGTPSPDVIAGLGGNDSLRGFAGDDIICGGGGKDRLLGGLGSDTLLGEAGNDVLRGNGGDDLLNGGQGADTCDGGDNGAAGDEAMQCESVVNVP